MLFKTDLCVSLIIENKNVILISRWANQCLGQKNMWHDKNRRTLRFRSVGQNYASRTHTAKLGDKFLTTMIQDLYDEASKIYSN